jgi:dTDP-glucose 4,6-dehydratase
VQRRGKLWSRFLGNLEDTGPLETREALGYERLHSTAHLTCRSRRSRLTCTFLGGMMDKEIVFVTGGMGFMGSHLVKKLASLNRFVVVIDSFTYAARNVKFSPNVYIERCDITDHWALSKLFDKYDAKICFHLAAESHVCRSIEGPRDFVQTNVVGTFHVAQECARKQIRMVHISTDEVFGEIKKGTFKESSNYNPRSPYAASKASGDHIVRCYGETYGLDYVIIHPSNNFGTNQHEEKLIPRTILSLLSNREVIVHGKGNHVREWLWVKDFVDGVILLAKKSKPKQSYCLGGDFECTNLTMILWIHTQMNLIWGDRFKLKLIHTNDRPSDDFRYAMSSTKAKALGFRPQPHLIKERIRKTVLWYFEEARGLGTVKEGNHG